MPRPTLRPVALHGILEDMVYAACANSEAVPAAVAIHILARFAATLGRTAFIEIGDQRRHLRMNALIVGPTAKGRKGTSSEMPRKLFHMVEERASAPPLHQLTALATGEGLIHQLRDPHIWMTGEKEYTDPGVLDKRLFCDVSEFAGVLAQGRRDGATLTTVIRDAFDGIPLTIPTKTSFNQATDTHIVIVGSVPETEIVKNLSEVDKTNGFANRFPMFYSARSKIVPLPLPTDPAYMEHFATHLHNSLYLGTQAGHVQMDGDARAYWRDELYHRIESMDYPANVASLLARRSLFTLIFAALLALLNHNRLIEVAHLDAADAWMDYWVETALFVFSSSESTEQTKKVAALKDEVVAAISALGGVKVTHTVLANKVTNGYQRKGLNAKQVKDVIELLQRESPPRIHTEVITTMHRPVSCYTLFGLVDAFDGSDDP